jgi:hypothetical protein
VLELLGPWLCAARAREGVAVNVVRAVVVFGANDGVVMLAAAMMVGLGLFVWVVSHAIGTLRRWLDHD